MLSYHYTRDIANEANQGGVAFAVRIVEMNILHC